MLWFGVVTLGLPLPFAGEILPVVVQVGAGTMVVLWTPAAAVLAGWLTGRWTGALWAGAPLPLVRLLVVGLGIAVGPARGERGLPSNIDDLALGAVALSIPLVLLLAADVFWLIVGGTLGASRLLHRPGWEPLPMVLTALGAGAVALAALVLLLVLWVALGLGVDAAGLNRRQAPPTLVFVIFALTLVPSPALYLVASAVSRRPLTMPLGLATAGLATMVLVALMLDASFGLLDALMAATVFGPLLGVVGFAGVLLLGALGTGVGRMARGERLFGAA